jgi:hypothetical protein
MVVVAAGSTASAAPCGRLSGDPALVAAVEQVLERNEVQCDSVHAHLRYDGTTIVITSDDAMPLERRVSDIATAATVVESWSGTTVADPLLAARPVPIVVAEAPPPPPPPARPIVITREAPVVVPVHGWQLFASGETSVANDRTSWVGAQVGGCVVIGPLCATARVRYASVVAGPAPWDGTLDRRNVELLVGGDVPLRLGHGWLLVGFGGGTGEMHTRLMATDLQGGLRTKMGRESGGLRADVHTSWVYPLRRDLGIDFSFALDLMQATRTESSSTMPLPEEPLVLARFGVGLRYGRLQ